MSEDLQWEARKFADKVLKKSVQDEIAKLALVLLGNHKLSVDYNKEGFDRYPYCKHDTKKYCPVGSKTMHYRGSWREYMVYGKTRTDVYLEVLKCLANEGSLYYPVVAFRGDDHWIEKEKYEQLKNENKKYEQAIKESLEKCKWNNVESAEILENVLPKEDK